MHLKYLIVLSLLSNCNPVSQERPTGRDVRIFKDTPVWEAAFAIRDNDTVKLKKVLQGKPKSILEYKEKFYGQTLLNWAVYRDDYNSAKELVELGSDPNIKSYDSTTAVIHAADKLESSYLKLLLDNGGNPNTIADIDKPQHLRTPLMAASYKSLANVRLLINAGADPNYVHRSKRGNIGGENIQSALISAFSGNRIDVVKFLLIDTGVEYNYIFSTTIDGKPHTILTYLRDMPFPLESEEYKVKMEVVTYLKERGLDYWKEPIPERYKKNYDESYLEKY
jgi:uncharacterized protein